MPTVWGRPNSINVQKVMWTVGELGLEHRRIDVGGPFGGLDTEEYGRLNPNRKIPTLVDGDVVVWESNAVVRYLAARYGAGTLWPEDPGERSWADRWMDWQITEVQPHLHVVFWNLIRTPPERRDADAVAKAAEALGRVWGIAEARLAAVPWLGGRRFTMGDIPLGCAYWRYRNLDIPRPDLPRLEDWFARLSERPAYRTHVMLPLS
ncbi:Glutathione S-transferase GstB [bacterium HR39]|nr:Glutathione S-transferase GstB [bacterium HR39]